MPFLSAIALAKDKEKNRGSENDVCVDSSINIMYSTRPSSSSHHTGQRAASVSWLCKYTSENRSKKWIVWCCNHFLISDVLETTAEAEHHLSYHRNPKTSQIPCPFHLPFFEEHSWSQTGCLNTLGIPNLSDVVQVSLDIFCPLWLYNMVRTWIKAEANYISNLMQGTC